MKKILAVLFVVALVLCATLVIGSSNRATKHLLITDCQITAVDSRLVKTFQCVDDTESVSERGWDNVDASQAIVLLLLRVTRPVNEQVDIDSTEFSFAYGTDENEYDEKDVCHAMRVTKDRPSLANNKLLLYGPVDPNCRFGIHWSKDEPNEFYLVLAMEVDKKAKGGDLLVGVPRVHWTKGGANE